MTFFGFFLLEFSEVGVFLVGFAVAEVGYAVAHCCCVELCMLQELMAIRL